MGSIHLPWPAGSRRGRRLRPAVLAFAVTAALMGAAVTAHSAAYAATGTPFGGTPAAVPGTVYAANYDTGGQGVGYKVTSTNGTANSYRSDGVDLETASDTSPTTAGGNGYDLGWTATGQWFNYTVNVAIAGTYTVAIRLSSPYGITDALHIANSSGTNLSGAVAIPTTGGYQDWTTVNTTVILPVGEQTLTVDQDDNGWNFHYMTFTLSSSGSGGSGTFPVTFQNNTRGTWSNSQIYVLILGQAVPGQWSYLKADGTLAHINHLDASAPGHLTKNGVNYPNMSFTLAQASAVTIPARLEGARMYISVGSPMYIAVSPDDQGWAGPDLSNPADPNIDVYFDWYEFTYQFGVTAFGGNTTQVDMFGFPMTARLQQTAIGYDQTVGITLTRAQVMSQYAAAVGSAFQSLAGTYRIVAPRSSALFQPGGAQANYLQSYINQTWAYYTANQFTLTRLNQTFTGRVSGNTLTFTKDGTGPFVLNRPTTADVMACSGALASGGMSTTALEFGAEFCAAFNRGVAMNTAEWYNPAAYYTGAIKNDYAGFFHTISLNHLAYGFAYDDINDQSSVQILPNANPPSSLTIGVGW